MDNKALLASQKAKYVEYDVVGLGAVQLRILSRAECLELRQVAQELHGDDVDEESALAFERLLLAKSLDVSEDDIVAWQDVASVDQVNSLLEKVIDVNGLGEQSAKTAYKSPQAKRRA